MAAPPPELRLVTVRGRPGSEPPPESADVSAEGGARPFLHPVASPLSALMAVRDAPLRERLQDLLTPAFTLDELPEHVDPLLFARRLRPDLIVGLLEPGSPDGPALCRHLRAAPDLADTLLCLVSTAATVPERIEALRAGADDVLDAAMEPEELVARLEARVLRRRALRARYTARLAVYAHEVPLTQADTALLQRVVDQVEAHFHEADFTARALARAVGVSDAVLKQRLRALLDCSPVALLRQRRLERAARLLALGVGGVREVAALCGFASAPYFARTFRERFGVPPSAYPPG